MSSDLIVEEWRPISGYDNYQVSNLGQIKNTKTGRILKPDITSGGYVQLSKDGAKAKHLVHRLVASAFASSADQAKVKIPPILANVNRACNRKRYGGSCILT